MARANRHTLGFMGMFAGLALLAGPVSVAAQGRFALTVDPRIGGGFALGDLRDTHDIGVAGGVGITFKLHPNIGIRGDVDGMVLDEESPEFGVVLAPTLTVLHYHAGLELSFGPDDDHVFPLTLRWSLGGGQTSISGDRDFPDEVDVDFSATYPSATTGLKIGHRVSPNFDVFLGGQLFVTFADEEETVELVKRSPGTAPYGTILTMPVTIGAQLAF